MVIPKHTVIQYVRNKKGVPRGVLVAVKNGNFVGHQGFKIGYSLCNKKDRFSKKMALDIAIGRARRAISSNRVVVGASSFPCEISKMYNTFFDRCLKYYGR